MSHTNSTPNYNLPQFVGTDKPTWLNDVNGAMSAIDTQMKANADSATSAGTSATTANNAIGTLSNLNTTKKTDLVSAVNEVNTNLGITDGKADSAVSSAISANDKVDGVSDYLDLTSFTTYAHNSGNVTKSSISTTGGDVSVAHNRLGTLCKIYGNFEGQFTNGWSSGNYTINVDTGLRPSEDINISPVGIITSGSNFNIKYTRTVWATIKTDGKVVINFPTCDGGDDGKFKVELFPCLYMLKNFGDTQPDENN